MHRITFITSNPNKLLEMQNALGPSCTLTSLSLDIPEIQGTTEEIAIAKCTAAYAQFTRKEKTLLITEDTALHFHALKGLPGPYIKPFLEKLGPEGLVALISSSVDKKATAKCTLALHTGQEVKLFVGEVEGVIKDPEGSRKFGWDCVFAPTHDVLNKEGKRFSEMTIDDKKGMSHRGRAVEKLMAFLSDFKE